MIYRLFKPKETIEENDLKLGMQMILFDGICSQIMGVLTTGAFLAAFALLIGASNKVIGLIAAIGPLTQFIQIPAIYLIHRAQIRRGIVVMSSILSRVFWLIIAALPWVVPESLRIPIFLISLVFYFGFGAISGCAWNSWVRDLIPDKQRGTYFGHRLAVATTFAAAVSLGAGLVVDYYSRTYTDNKILVYSVLLSIGGLAGLAGVYFLWRTPEPKMQVVSDKDFLRMLKEPFKDLNFRRLLFFLGSWNFSVNFVAPFFAVYMLKRLGLTMTWIIGLAVLSQVFNIVFFRIWGAASDRFSNKSVLTVSGSLFIFSFLLWPLTTMPEKYVLTLPILIVIHIVAGISTAGVALCSGNIAVKLAPYGQATAYLAVNAIICGLGATLAPILAGILSDYLTNFELNFLFNWKDLRSETPGISMPAFSMRGLDFLFIPAFVMGLYSLHRLLGVNEEGEMDKDYVVRHVYEQGRRIARAISNVAGLRTLTAFPFALLDSKRKSGRREDAEKAASD